MCIVTSVVEFQGQVSIGYHFRMQTTKNILIKRKKKSERFGWFLMLKIDFESQI